MLCSGAKQHNDHGPDHRIRDHSCGGDSDDGFARAIIASFHNSRNRGVGTVRPAASINKSKSGLEGVKRSRPPETARRKSNQHLKNSKLLGWPRSVWRLLAQFRNANCRSASVLARRLVSFAGAPHSVRISQRSMCACVVSRSRLGAWLSFHQRAERRPIQEMGRLQMLQTPAHATSGYRRVEVSRPL